MKQEKEADLWASLVRIKKQKQWIKAIERLGLEAIPSKGSHYTARRPGYELQDMNGLVVTIQYHVRKDVNEEIFKTLMKKGFKEDDIWKALDML